MRQEYAGVQPTKARQEFSEQPDAPASYDLFGPACVDGAGRYRVELRGAYDVRDGEEQRFRLRCDATARKKEAAAYYLRSVDEISA